MLDLFLFLSSSLGSFLTFVGFYPQARSQHRLGEGKAHIQRRQCPEEAEETVFLSFFLSQKTFPCHCQASCHLCLSGQNSLSHVCS